MSDAEFLNSVAEQLTASAEETRYTAVEYLVRLNSADAVPLLMKVMDDSSSRIREEALNGICAFPQGVIFPQLEDFLRNNSNANLRNVAIEGFPRYGKNATAYLLNLLKDKDEEVRMFSASILGDIKDPKAVADLIGALKDEDENVKHAAAESLGRIGDARAVAPLIDCLYQDFWLQYPAIIALGSIGDPTATSSLINFLDDEMLQQAVIEALGKIGDESVVKVLADILSSDDPSTRNDIIASLVNIQQLVKPGGTCLPSIKKALDNNELVEYLLDSLQDADLKVKKNAITALGWLKKKRVVRNLITLLTDYDVEEYVVGSLVSIGENALPELVEELQNPEPKIQILLIRCIEWIGHIDGIEACIPFLKLEHDDEVRYQAVMAMAGALDSERIERELLALLSDPDTEVQRLLVGIMGKSRSKNLAKKLLKVLFSEIHSERLTAIKILGQLKNPVAFTPLKKLLEDEDDAIRAQAYKALSTIYPEQLSSKIVLKGLKDKSSVVRKAVVRCAGANLGENVENTLFSLLKDHDPNVHLAAIETLGKIGSFSCIEPLTTNFATCNKQLRLAIIRAMGNIKEDDSSQFLIDLLEKKDSDLKRAAIESLGEIGDEQSIPNLVVALDDPDWSIRSSAIQALAKTGNQKCSVHLMQKLGDPEDIVKKEAILALSHLSPAGAVNFILPLIHNENLQLMVLSALEKLGVPDLEFFNKFFERSNARLKCLLVELLGRLEDPKAIGFLSDLLKDEFVTVRCHAAKALGKLGDRDAIPILLKTQRKDQSKEVQKEAMIALKKLDIKK